MANNKAERKGKSPLSDLVGKLIQSARKQRGLTEALLCERMPTPVKDGNLKASYLRAIESGAMLFPLARSADLAAFFGWNHDLCLNLLAVAAACDRRVPNGLAAEAERSALLKQYQLQAERSSVLSFVWKWAVDACNHTETDALYRHKRDEVIARLLNEFKANQLTLVANDVSTDSARASRQETTWLPDLSPYLATPLAAVGRELEKLRNAVLDIVPVMNQRGLYNLDQINRDQMVAVYAFLGYTPDPIQWEKAPFDFAFLLNEHRPTLCVVLDKAPDDIVELQDRLNAMIGRKLRQRQAQRHGTKFESRQFIELRVAKAPLGGNLRLDFSTLKWRLSSDRNGAEIVCRNAWVYEILDRPSRRFLAVLDDYSPHLVDGEGGLVTGIALPPHESARFVEEMLPTQ